jgi:hypothetical protein
MTWAPRDREIESVSGLDASARYNHLIKKVADTQQIWTSPWRNGTTAVWPHERYAQRCLSAAASAHAVALSDWMQKLDTSRTGATIQAFPTTHDEGLILDPGRMRADIARELHEGYGE